MNERRAFAWLLPCILSCALSCAPAAPKPTTARPPDDVPRALVHAPVLVGATVHRATRKEASDLLGTRDSFIEAMSPFDRAIRMKRATPPPVDELLSFVSQQAVEISAADWEAMQPVLEKLGAALGGLYLPLPPSVAIVRTTGAEEFDVPYTRGSAIILPASVFRGGKGPSLGLLAHELFHVASRTRADFRDRMYRLVGFVPIKPVELPASLDGRRITNPDGHSTRHAIMVRRGLEAAVAVVPVLQSRKAAGDIEGSPLASLDLVLLVVDEKTGAVLVDEHGAPRTLSPGETDYASQCAINTEYAIHPDEVVADNFALLVRRRTGQPVDVAEPKLLDRLEKTLTQIRD